MKKKIQSLGKWSYLLGIILGGLVGFAYWKFIGCSNGHCAITSSPVISTLYFAGLGGLVNSVIKNNF